MAFGGFDDNPGASPMSEINTTPLVDVMLVLLVIFIITAPLFHQAVPKLADKPHVIQLALDEQGSLYWNGEAIGGDALAARFLEERSLNPELHLRADRATRYERVAEVMAAAQKAGITKIAFVTDPVPR